MALVVLAGLADELDDDSDDDADPVDVADDELEEPVDAAAGVDEVESERLSVR